MSAADDVARLVAQARADYLTRLPAQLQTLLQLAQESRRDTQAIESLRAQAHRIHGTSGSYGLVAVSALVGRLEQLADAAQAAARPIEAAAVDAIVAELHALSLG